MIRDIVPFPQIYQANLNEPYLQSWYLLHQWLHQKA